MFLANKRFWYITKLYFQINAAPKQSAARRKVEWAPLLFSSKYRKARDQSQYCACVKVKRNTLQTIKQSWATNKWSAVEYKPTTYLIFISLMAVPLRRKLIVSLIILLILLAMYKVALYRGKLPFYLFQISILVYILTDKGQWFSLFVCWRTN